MPPRYLLDTNLCIALIRKSSPKAERRLARRRVTDVAISALTVAELEYGVAKSRQPKLNREKLDLFLQPLQVLSFDDAAALAYGAARASLEARGHMIGPIEMLLAAQALSLEATLVTNNTAEFRVDGLKVQDWTK
ncbi:MAG: PIN domain-containing protein [Gemmatimonadetes bacterium]|nr:PIN domain-containing protein [Gemmatimonadota bacterium]